MTAEDRSFLLSSLPNSIIIDKIERDKTVAKALQNYPNCFKYRNSIIYGQKLLDIMLFDQEDTLYIDCDIFFIKKFRLPKFEDTAVFMSDTMNAYSFQPKDFIHFKLPLYPYLNAGFFFFPRKLYDLDFIERLLNDAVIHKCLYENLLWSEQTIWAFLTAQSKVFHYFDYDQIMMAQQVMKAPVKDNITQNTIGVHLISSLRGHVFDGLQAIPVPAVTSAIYVQVKLKRANRFLNLTGFAKDRLQKKWRQIRQDRYLKFKDNWTR